MTNDSDVRTTGQNDQRSAIYTEGYRHGYREGFADGLALLRASEHQDNASADEIDSRDGDSSAAQHVGTFVDKPWNGAAPTEADGPQSGVPQNRCALPFGHDAPPDVSYATQPANEPPAFDMASYAYGQREYRGGGELR